jgi:hypothetical protein
MQPKKVLITFLIFMPTLSFFRFKEVNSCQSMPKGILPHTQGDKGVQGQRRLTTLPAESKCAYNAVVDIWSIFSTGHRIRSRNWN